MLGGKITELLKEMKKCYQPESDLFSYDGLQACLCDRVMVHQVNTSHHRGIYSVIFHEFWPCSKNLLTEVVLYVRTGSKERASSMTLDFCSISSTGFTTHTVKPHLHVTAFIQM